MLFAPLQKKGKYVGVWSERRIMFDTESGMLYRTGKEEENFHFLWRHKVRVMRIIAQASVVKFDYSAPNFDICDLFTFRLEGSTREVNPSFISQVNQPEYDAAVVRPFPKNHVEDDSDVGTGEMEVWYMRAKTYSDFMTVYSTIRDALIKKGLRPPRFWGLPNVDPRINVPLGESPLHMWYRLRAVKQAVFYACVQGRMAVKSPNALFPQTPLTLSEEPLYLTLFDNSVMVFNEDKHVVAGIPITEIRSLHYATVDVTESLRNPKNEDCRCFLALTTDNAEYSDILFVPTLDRFAEASEKNVPAAQVERVRAALAQLAPVTRRALQREGREGAPLAEVVDAAAMAAGREDDVASSANGLLDVCASAVAEGRPLRLPEIPASEYGQRQSDLLIAKLPPPARLSELASEFGIHVEATPVGCPHGFEYSATEATVTDPTCPKKKNPLHDLFVFSKLF